MSAAPGWPMASAYAAAHGLLADGLMALGRPVPERISLRLREADGLLLSAAARQARTDAALLARALAPTLDGSPFDRADADGGMVLLHLSPLWLEAALETLLTLPWPETPPLSGTRRQDSRDASFLLHYTSRRCRALAGRGGRGQAAPEALLCLLLRGPDRQPERWGAELMRRYWALPPEGRRDARLAGAVGRIAAILYGFPGDLQKIHLTAPICGIISKNVGYAVPAPAGAALPEK